MKAAQFTKIIKRLTGLTGHQYKDFHLNDEYKNRFDCGEDLNTFLNGLNDKCQKINLAMLRNSVDKEHFPALVEAIEVPFLTFIRKDNQLVPAIFNKHRNGDCTVYVYPAEFSTENPEEAAEEENEVDDSFFESVHIDEHGQVIYLTPFSLHPLFTDSEGKNSISPVTRLVNLLMADRKDILYIYFYALIISLISLSLPLGIQAIMSMVSGGIIFNSIVLLISFVLLGVLATGSLQILQYSIVEALQRRVFTRAALEFTYRIPKVRSEALLHQYAPELMNRFFDVLTIQKGMPKVLIDLAGSGLQILFGLMLLAFYHPFFVFFGITLLLILAGIFYFTGPGAMRTSMVESKYKYKVAHWLEEIARTLNSFKLAGHTDLPLSKMEDYVNNYLYYRKKHFRVLMTQFANVVAFKTIVTGGLLIIGTTLVIDRQITLGQFIASEIIIIMIITAVEKIILNMSTVYDMLTAVDKLSAVTDLPLERRGGIRIPHNPKVGMHIKIKNLRYKYPESSSYSLKDITLEIKPGERVCVAGYTSSGKNTLMKVLSGILDNYEGMVTIDNISLRDVELDALRDVIAKNVSMEDIFEGTLLENITMGKSSIGYEDVVWAIESLGLSETVNSLPDGLMTQLVAGGKRFSAGVIIKLLLARCVAERPQLLILNDFLHDLHREERLRIINFLLDRQNPWTLLSVSNDPTLLSACDRIVLMQNGKVVETGTYEELVGNPLFQDILVNRNS